MPPVSLFLKLKLFTGDAPPSFVFLLRKNPNENADAGSKTLKRTQTQESKP
jgi:hypothetical protein